MIRGLPGRRILFLAAFFLLAASPVPAYAGTQDGAVFALHASPHVKGDPCARIDQFYSQGSDCTDFTTEGELLEGYDLYIVLAGADPDFGVAFTSFGVLYNNGAGGGWTMSDLTGVDVYEWTPCHTGTSVFYPPETSPDAFPASGSGLRITWDAETDCQTAVPGNASVEIVIGCLYVFAYSRDYFHVRENMSAPDGPEYLVGDCNGEWSTLQVGPLNMYQAFVWFSSGAVEPGNNPCFHVPVQRTSWGRIKTTYSETEARP